jgi:glc operon protein GlcG
MEADMEITTRRATLTSEAVMLLLQGALDHAGDLGKSVYVAVMDASARLIGLVGSDAAPRICADVAQHKAYTAVSMRMPTAAFKAMLDHVASGEREIFMADPGHIAADGGLPVIVDGLIAGGVGVSGGGQAEDAACARAALVALGLESG